MCEIDSSPYVYDDDNEVSDDDDELNNRNPRVRQNGHTWRRTGWNYCSGHDEVTISRERKSIKSENGDVEVAVTEVDRYFDLGFIYPSSHFYCGWRMVGDRPLNKKVMWEQIEEELLVNSLRKVQTFDKHQHSVTIEYYMPVLGHLCFNNRVSAEDQDINTYLQSCSGQRTKSSSASNLLTDRSRWLQWNGRFLDPSFIYEYIDAQTDEGTGSLRALCKLWTSHSILSMSSNNHSASITPQLTPQEQLVTTSLTNLTHTAEFRRKYGHILGCGVLQDRRFSTMFNGISLGINKAARRIVNRKTSLIVDMRSECAVSCLVLLGGYPRDLVTFPFNTKAIQTKKRSKSARQKEKLKQQKARRKWRKAQQDKKYRRRRRRRSPFVYVVRENASIGWLSECVIEHRPSNRGKWFPCITTATISATGAVTANHDIGTETVIDLHGLRTRFIRITPVAHHRRLEARVSVFGETIVKVLQSNVNCRDDSDDELEDKNEEEDEEGTVDQDKEMHANVVQTVKYTVHKPNHSVWRLDGSQWR